MALKRRSERRAVARPENATLPILIFRVGASAYGLEIAALQQIERLQPITRVPEALAFVEGVIHVRGAIIPVVDLARRFGLPPIGEAPQARIVIARLGGRSVGFIVSAVSEVRPIPTAAIGAPPELTFAPSARFVTGIATIGEQLVSLLSVERLLSDAEFAQLPEPAP